MLVTSIPTVLIPIWRQICKPRKGRGSVACTEQVRGSGAIRSKPSGRVSRIWLRVSFFEDEIHRGVNASRCHTMAKVASRSVHGRVLDSRATNPDRRTPNEGANGIESRPKYDNSLLNVNMGSPKLVVEVKRNQYGDGVPIVPNRLPVMGLATGNQSGPNDKGSLRGEHKSAVMPANPCRAGGRGTAFVFSYRHERRNASAFRKNK